MHDGMPYDPIQGQGHESLKATQEESTFSRMGLFFSVFIVGVPCSRLS